MCFLVYSNEWSNNQKLAPYSIESPPPIRYKSGAPNASFSALLTLERLNYSTIDLLELHFVYPVSSGGSRHPLLARPMLITVRR